jgi:Leucine-rich repeat (LRR) protein
MSPCPLLTFSLPFLPLTLLFIHVAALFCCCVKAFPDSINSAALASVSDSFYTDTARPTGDTCQWAGVSCDAGARALHRYWGRTNASGAVPCELARLSHLNHLDLSRNRISHLNPGCLPRSLRFLDMDHNPGLVIGPSAD